MEMIDKIRQLTEMVSHYNTESFAGFFDYFIRRRPGDYENIDLNKFDSKLKDFLYLIGLNAFSEKKGTDTFEFDPGFIGELADKLNSIKNGYRVQSFSEHSLNSVIHEMAFRNHFDNGV